MASAVLPADVSAPAASAAAAANSAAAEVPAASTSVAAMAAPGSPASSAVPGPPAALAAPVLGSGSGTGSGPSSAWVQVERRGARIHAVPEGFRALWLYTFDSVSLKAREDVARLQETSDDRLWWGDCDAAFSNDVERSYQDLHGECTHVLRGRSPRVSPRLIKVDFETMLQHDEWGIVRKMRRALVEYQRTP